MRKDSPDPQLDDFLQRLSRNFPPADAVLRSWPQGVFCCQSKRSHHASWPRAGRQPTDESILILSLWHLSTTSNCGHFFGGILIIFIPPFRVPLPPLVEWTKFTFTLSAPLCAWSCESLYLTAVQTSKYWAGKFAGNQQRILTVVADKKLWDFVSDFVLCWHRHWVLK